MDISSMRGGPDVSHWGPVHDWGALVATGAKFFGAKACEGAHTVDTAFAAHLTGFRQHSESFDLAVWYTMFHVEKDPVSQAELLVDTVGPLGPRETLGLDFEDTSYENVDPAIVQLHGLSMITTFFARLKSLGVLGNTRPVMYTSDRHWQHLGDPDWPWAEDIDLWVPRYHPGTPEPPPVLPKPWRAAGWKIWQWTDCKTGIVSPCPGVGRCDRDVLAPGYPAP